MIKYVLINDYFILHSRYTLKTTKNERKPVMFSIYYCNTYRAIAHRGKTFRNNYLYRSISWVY